MRPEEWLTAVTRGRQKPPPHPLDTCPAQGSFRAIAAIRRFMLSADRPSVPWGRGGTLRHVGGEQALSQ